MATELLGEPSLDDYDLPTEEELRAQIAEAEEKLKRIGMDVTNTGADAERGQVAIGNETITRPAGVYQGIGSISVINAAA